MEPQDQIVDDGWQEVASEFGKSIRWHEQPRDTKEAEKTIYLGDTIHGIYEGKRENVGENNATVYSIQTVDHGLVSVWDTTVLRDKMKKTFEGNEIRIVRLGEVKPKGGGKAYYNFQVFQREPDKELLGKIMGQKQPVSDEKSGPSEIKAEDVPM